MARSRITGEQIVDADVLSEDEHDSWVHKNLVCSGTVTVVDGGVECDDVHTASVFLGDTELSAENGTLLVNDAPIDTGATTISGYTGVIPIMSTTTVSGNEYSPPTTLYFNFDNAVMQAYLTFENGILKVITPGGQIIFSSTAGEADNLLSIL